ncbi:MAG: hypothetical protein K5795_05045 [Lachnospiraceae bacterium]|nr:hypothetical protein [Lachnospiraceae bacterium]
MENYRKKRYLWRKITAWVITVSCIICRIDVVSVKANFTGLQNEGIILAYEKENDDDHPKTNEEILMERIEDAERVKYGMTRHERNLTLTYLSAIHVERGGDPALLSASDLEAIDYIQKLIEVSQPGLNTAAGELAGREVNKEATIAKEAYNSMKTKLIKDYSQQVTKNNKIWDMKTKAINNLNEKLSHIKNKATIRDTKQKLNDAHLARGQAKSRNSNINNKIEQGAKEAQTDARNSAAAKNRAMKTLGIILNVLIYAVDMYDLYKDNMVSKQTHPGDKYKVAGERAAVQLDALLAVAGVAALTGVAVSPIGWGYVLAAGVVTLLTHTETGQAVFDATTGGLYESYLDSYYDTEQTKIIGKKMLEHLKDDAYMEHLLDTLKKKHAGRTKPANGVGALKPNIYLYPEEQTDVIVSFDHPELLTTVIPDYSGNWSVTAEPDGTLHSEDGQDYSYLFYESETQPFFFGNSEGWLIEADERAERYTEILKEYGFNDKEIADFVEFWVEKLPEGLDYMMYPNVTEVIDKAMPVTFSTEPDSIFRIWFTFEPYDGQIVPEPEIDEIARDGFTVVEWGGVILD